MQVVDVDDVEVYKQYESKRDTSARCDGQRKEREIDVVFNGEYGHIQWPPVRFGDQRDY